MPKTSETKVALKGENPKKAPNMSDTTRKAPSHTEEVQNVSDSQGSTSDSSSGHSSGSESDAEKRSNTKKPRPSKVKDTEPNSPPVPEDSSEDDSSDSDSDADLEAAVAKAKEQRTNAKKTPAAVTSNGAALKTSKASKSSEKVSESDDSSDDSDVEMADADTATSKASGQAAADKTTAPAIVPAQPFVPPPGYKSLHTKSALAKTVNSLFDPSSLSSKQVWHITAPSSVPLSDIKSISLSAIQSHQTILSHNGTDYNLAEEPTNNARVLLPSSKSDAYTAVQVPVSKTLHLQQTVRLPNLSSYQTDPTTGSNAAASIKTPAVSTRRPQPKGMRMRYKPPGFGDDDPGLIGSSEDESEDNAKSAEKSAKGSRSKRKRDEAIEETPKDKKRRKAAEAAEKLNEGTLAEVPQTAEEKARKKAEKKEKKKNKSK